MYSDDPWVLSWEKEACHGVASCCLPEAGVKGSPGRPQVLFIIIKIISKLQRHLRAEEGLRLKKCEGPSSDLPKPPLMLVGLVACLAPQPWKMETEPSRADWTGRLDPSASLGWTERPRLTE